jgi:alanine racemase
LPRTAWLEIDLGRLAANVAAIRRALPTAALEIVVKADAYGHGAAQVASAALGSGATGLCVATLDEALELRAAGIEAPVLVLFAIPPDGAPAAARAGIQLTAGDAGLAERALAAYRAAGRRARRGLPALAMQLAIETGLGRDGLTAREAVAVAAAIAATPGAVLGGAWSHLQAPGDRARTDDQVARFAAAVAALRRAGAVVPHRHVLASGGLLSVGRLVAGRRPVFDGLRVGLAAYGIAPDGLEIGSPAAGIHAALRPVLSLRARPIRVADVPPGVGISYGPSFVTGRASRIATLPVGYADGWSRGLSNRAAALVRGRRVPLVGTVAMDAVMADVTDVPGPPVTLDDEFVLLGEQAGDAITAADLAQQRTTISWEIVATMSRRLPRVYTAGAVAVGIRTLTEERGSWRSLRSGTATSATWRSTRS